MKKECMRSLNAFRSGRDQKTGIFRGLVSSGINQRHVREKKKVHGRWPLPPEDLRAKRKKEQTFGLFVSRPKDEEKSLRRSFNVSMQNNNNTLS